MSHGSGLRAAAAALLFATTPLAAVAFTVNSTADPGDGTCDAVECTLREAIGAVNATNKKRVIDFDPQVFVMGTPGVIAPTTGLPAIIGSKVKVDGSGAGVVIDGTALAGGESGLVFASGAGNNLSKVTLVGVTVVAFPAYGVSVCGGDVAACADDVSKVHIEDVVAADNGLDGLRVQAARISQVRVVGAQLVANSGHGLLFTAGLSNDLHKATVSGSTARGNGDDGFQLNASRDNEGTRIEDSVAAGNGGQGFQVNAGGDLSKAKLSGLQAVSNSAQGLLVNAGDAQSRVSLSESRLAGNGQDGASLNAGGELSRAKLSKNSFLYNNGAGFRLDGGGGVQRSKLTDNDASFNDGSGVRIFGSRNLAKGNVASANASDGILLEGSGSRSRLQKNETHANGAGGIRIGTANAQNTVVQNRALGNDVDDLVDDNPSCGTNDWKKNTFTFGNEPCIE